MKKITLNLFLFALLLSQPARLFTITQRRVVYFWTGQHNYKRSAAPTAWCLTGLFAFIAMATIYLVIISVLS